jgi:single-stranded-DNA-specific exonuclease
VIIFALVNENELKGSARSVPGINIRDILDTIATANKGLVTRFGGHAMAAGLSILRTSFNAFARAFDEEIRKHLTADRLQGEIHSDGELAPDDMGIELADMLRNAGPWGQNFPEPVFDGQFKLLEQRIVGGKHLKMTLALAKNAPPIEAIAFNINIECWPNHRAEYINAAYRLDINEFRGIRQVQLLVEYLEPCNPGI